MHRWSEPLVIAKLVRNNGVLLTNPVTGVIVRTAQVGQLKPYMCRSLVLGYFHLLICGHYIFFGGFCEGASPVGAVAGGKAK